MQLNRLPQLEKVRIPGPASFAVREFDLDAFDHGWHEHPEAELTWILEGCGMRYVGDSVEPFGPGDFCLLGPNLPHMWLSRKGGDGGRARSLVVQFDPERLGAGLLQLPEMARIARLLERSGRGIRFERDTRPDLRKKIERSRTPLTQFTALLETLDELADHPHARPLSLTQQRPTKRLTADPRLRRVLERLSESLDQPISHAEAARLAGLTPAAFSRFFRRSVGKTFQAYLTDMRLSVACRELLETDHTISEIAYAAGFGNLSSFNRAFRLQRGMSPSEFRRQSLKHV